jgi:V-type H+-transporting ATPase subunit a
LEPPTYFKTNEVTDVYQCIANTYGIPTFGEANPAVVSIITFPFLFGVMFGDIGHGLMLLVVAGLVCQFGDQILVQKNQYLNIVVWMRYLLLLMGFFATYMGLIYNDCMSIPLQLFGEGCYKEVPGQAQMAKTDEHCIYSFGIDPSWMNAQNDIAFYNSFKMKSAVILGVSHMLIGLGCKGLNAIHFDRKLDFFHEFVPQVILLCSLFGFMNTLVIVKWSTDWSGREDVAPTIIGIIIDMFVNFGEK